MQRQLKSLFPVLIASFFFSACGQKGPLFLPGNTNEVSTSIPGQQQSSRTEDDDDENKKPINNNQ